MLKATEKTSAICTQGSTITVTQLELEIVQWFMKDDAFQPLKRIRQAFPDRSKSEICNALDHLCELNILYGGKMFMGTPYGLVNAEGIEIL